MGLIATILVAAACSPENEAPERPSAPQIISDAMLACIGGQVDSTILVLDSLLNAVPSADGFAVRAACHRQRHAQDSTGRRDKSAPRAAYDDLTRAIEASGEGDQLPLSGHYSQRAFVRLTLDSTDLSGALEDLDRAVAVAPEAYQFRLDRGVAHAMLGDTLAARRDYEWVLDRPDVDSTAEAQARQRLAALE